MANGKEAASQLRTEEVQIDIGKNKKVSIRQFRGVNLVDIREYYDDKASGESRPGKKGISLTEESWNLLIENQSSIKKALDRLNGVEDLSHSEDDQKLTESLENAKSAAKKRKLQTASDDEES